MPEDKSYNVITTEKGVPVKAWTKGVPLEGQARTQLLNVAQLPFIFKWVAVMPDVHWGIGPTVGSVIPTKGAIIPAAVGVDIGCGMMAVQTHLNARDLPDINLKGTTFSLREKPLAKICGFLPFSSLCEKLDGIRKLGLSGSLKPNFLKTTAEFFTQEEAEG